MVEELAVKEIVKANAEAVYKDAAQPAVRVLGKSLAQCVSLFSTPVGRVAEIFERNLHRYIDKLEGLDENELIPPNTRILVPILEKMRFIEEETVAEYYAAILAAASKKEHAAKVMLTFIEILNRLTSDEIKILEYVNSLKNVAPIPELPEEKLKEYNLPKGTKNILVTGSLPVLEVQIQTSGKKGYSTIIKNFNYLERVLDLNSPESTGLYIDNMNSLGLFEKEFGATFVIKEVYYSLENADYLAKLRSELPKERTLNLAQQRIDTTELGKSLLELCVSQKK